MSTLPGHIRQKALLPAGYSNVVDLMHGNSGKNIRQR